MENKNAFKEIAVEGIKTQSDSLANKIRKMIVDGKLESGYQFPNENELCRLLNVGRSTLREAYKILDTQGYIKRTKHGTYVRDKEDVARMGNFKASLELASYDELAKFVCTLEPEAAYLAAKRITDEEVLQLEAMIIDCKERWIRGEEVSDVNFKLHEFVRNISGNRLIISALVAYYDIFCQHFVQDIYLDTEKHRKFIEDALIKHDELLDAFKRRDAEAAKRIAYEHLMADVEYHQP